LKGINTCKESVFYSICPVLLEKSEKKANIVYVLTQKRRLTPQNEVNRLILFIF